MEIKKIDITRPIIVDLEVNKLSIYHANMIFKNIDGIDGLGLIVKNRTYLNSLVNHLKNTQINFIYSEIDVNTLIQHEIFNDQESFFITAWRDTHESNKLTFDGIIDRKGRYKTDYFRLFNAIQKSNLKISEPNIRIIKPAVSIYDNNVLDYYSVYYSESEGWNSGSELKGYDLEWALIKCDKFGNYMAIRDVGVGPKLTLKIPKNNEYFRLLLNADNGETVSTTITTLNTPLVQSEKD